MSTYTQVERPIQIVTPLGEDVLLLEALEGREAVSRPFSFELSLLSEQRQIDFEAAVGMRATIKFVHEGGCLRYLNGHVVSFSQGASVQNLYRYRATLVPWLWLLSYSGGSRIFQHKSVPEIVSQIFRERGFSQDFSLRLGGSYEPREYCVQYRETDFGFVSRLLEEEGICYFFEHAEDKHTLVLTDQSSKFVPCPNQPVARYHTTADDHLDEDSVATWTLGQQVRTGKYTARDFNFEQPRFDLLATITGGDKRRFEQYDYPGEYLTRSLGEQLVRVRIEEQDAARVAATGTSDCRAFTAGYKFELADHYRPDANRAYVLLSVTHSAYLPANYEASAGGGGASYQNEFVCIPHTATPYRPPRTTPVPVVQGTQTATVVGPAGEEIYTDKYGRVKVQFHWDREGRYDENSSCWVRVSQPWAGKGWGAISVPRIGQEVVVDFLEGDPDRPLVVGRVYNAGQMPPYALPAEQTKSTMKTLSSKGGGGFNELRFEDRKGAEQIFIHAERDEDIRVKNDLREWVGRDTHLIVKHDRLEEVEGEQHLTVGGDKSEKAGGAISRAAGADIQEKAAGRYALAAGSEIHLKSGANLVLESGATVTLKAGGGFITIGPAGVNITGVKVKINSGGAPGAGSGSSPETPRRPLEADRDDPGQVSNVLPRPAAYGPQATALKNAARSGAPFCEVCQQ
ncbi:MAG TPA: type VI secretion system tip protein VgrG [Pyrinomonadaceae bacterium]|jgi:type VI secretion system secreted protein VgrG